MNLVYCFLGSLENMVDSNYFFVVNDHSAKGIFVISMPSKTTKPWAVECVTSVTYEVGYGEMQISLESGEA